MNPKQATKKETHSLLGHSLVERAVVGEGVNVSPRPIKPLLRHDPIKRYRSCIIFRSSLPSNPACGATASGVSRGTAARFFTYVHVSVCFPDFPLRSHCASIVMDTGLYSVFTWLTLGGPSRKKICFFQEKPVKAVIRIFIEFKNFL